MLARESLSFLLQVKWPNSTPVRVVSVFDNANVNSDTTIRILWFLRLYFVFDSERSVPLTSPLFLDRNLFDRDILGNLTMVTDYSVLDAFVLVWGTERNYLRSLKITPVSTITYSTDLF